MKPIIKNTRPSSRVIENIFCKIKNSLSKFLSVFKFFTRSHKHFPPPLQAGTRGWVYLFLLPIHHYYYSTVFSEALILERSYSFRSRLDSNVNEELGEGQLKPVHGRYKHTVCTGYYNSETEDNLEATHRAKEEVWCSLRNHCYCNTWSSCIP